MKYSIGVECQFDFYFLCSSAVQVVRAEIAKFSLAPVPRPVLVLRSSQHFSM
jgi:hypothetical protein